MAAKKEGATSCYRKRSGRLRNCKAYLTRCGLRIPISAGGFSECRC